MCRNRTPEDEQVACSRCGEVANPTDGWEHGWPNYGHIHVGFSSRIFDEVVYGGLEIGGDAWDRVRAHPAFKDTTAQTVEIEWGTGFKYGEDGGYRLCRDCQAAFLETLGRFFGLRGPSPTPEKRQIETVET